MWSNIYRADIIGSKWQVLLLNINIYNYVFLALKQKNGEAACRFITWWWCSGVNSVITALSVYRDDSNVCVCECESEREWEEEERHGNRRAGKRLLNSSFRGLGGSEYKDCMEQREKGGVTPCRLHMEDWDSAVWFHQRILLSFTHPLIHLFIYQVVTTTVEEASEYKGKEKTKAN